MSIAETELSEWLTGVSTTTGLDLSQYLATLVEQGLTKFLLHDVIEEDWPELVKPIGHRVVLKQAAAEMFAKAEHENLKAAIDRIRSGSDTLSAEGEQDRQSLTRVSSELMRVEQNLISAKKEFFAASNGSTAAQTQLTTMQTELATLKAEVEALATEVATVEQEKVAAMKAKEDAIMQAVEFGVSGARPPAPAAAAPAAATPSGYSFNQSPPPQQQQQQQQQQFQQPPQQQQFQQPPQQQQQQQQYQPPAQAYGQPEQQYQQIAPPQQQLNQQQQQQKPAVPRVDPNTPIESYPWYHGDVSRDVCESKLTGGAIGDFMVRKSTRGNNSYSLSVRAAAGPKHYKIEKQGQAWNLALRSPDGKKFQTIAHLINHYIANSPAGSAMVRPARR